MFLIALNDVIKERIERGEIFFDLEQEKFVNGEERYNIIINEISRISTEIFQDEEFYQEQFNGFKDYYDYINVIIDDIINEDSDVLVKVILRHALEM